MGRTIASWAGLSVTASLLCIAGAAEANQTHVPFTVAANATSAPIAVPAVNTPISITCSVNTLGATGIGQTTLLAGGSPAVLQWLGYDLNSTGLGVGPLTVSQGASATPGTHIIYCGIGPTVEIKVGSATTLILVNGDGFALTGVINFVW